MRTQEEIVTRLRAELENPSDFFGTGVTDLLEALDWDHGKEFTRDGTTQQEYEQALAGPDEEGLMDIVRKYFPFALEKADDHRGLSASRSISHFKTWIWILKTDEELAAFEATDYMQYGVPQLLKAAEIFGLRDEIDSLLTDELRRMATGLPCKPSCDYGCSL